MNNNDTFTPDFQRIEDQDGVTVAVIFDDAQNLVCGLSIMAGGTVVPWTPTGRVGTAACHMAVTEGR